MAYKRAPITEAVLEFRVADKVAQSEIEAIARRLKSTYSEQHAEETFQFKVDTKTKATTSAKNWSGMKLSSKDQTDTLILRENRFACIRLAPYCGWDEFRQRADRDWDAWRKAAGVSEITRVGLRYVNRIDVPLSPADDDRSIRVEDYLQLRIGMPDLVSSGPLETFTLRVVRPLGDIDECKLGLTWGTAQSPLVGFVSFLLDIDVFNSGPNSRRQDELWALVERMRDLKNRIFESCVTDKSRELFNQ